MPRGTPRRRLRAVAALEFLAAAAPARVVAADLLDRRDAALLDGRCGLRLGVLAPVGRGRIAQRAGLRGPDATRVGDAAVAGRGPGRRVLLLRRVAVLALDLDLDVEDHPREVRPDRGHEVGEQREGLVLVGDERL